MTEPLVSTLFAFLFCVALIVTLRYLTITWQLVDRPDAARKRHRGAVPLCGGLAIFIAFGAVSLTNGRPDVFGINVWLGLSFILLIGALDDRWSLPATGRLIIQLVTAAAFASATNIEALSLGSLFAPYAASLLPLMTCIAIVFVVGLVNSWNMLDGIDGLAGGAAAVATIWLILVAKIAGMADLIFLLETLFTCLCAFLIFNMRSPWRARASIFLGDAGSTTIGATIAYVILLLATGRSAVSFPALLWIVILPICDTLSLLVRRILAHRSPMSADRWHLHHLLLDCGFTPAAATTTLMVVSAICGGIGYAGIRTQVPVEVMALGLAVPIALHTLFVLATTGSLTRSRARPLATTFLASPAESRAAASGTVSFERVGTGDMEG